MRKKEMIKKIEELIERLADNAIEDNATNRAVLRITENLKQCFGKKWERYFEVKHRPADSDFYACDFSSLFPNPPPPSLSDIKRKVDMLYDYLNIKEHTDSAISENTYLKKKGKK